jgi:glycosyltransferase involved in cell wall biosynthesis
MPKKLVFIAQFPVDYQISIYNSCTKNFDVHVIFLSDFGLENAFDPEFGDSIKRFNKDRMWNFTSHFLRNASFKNNGSFFAHKKVSHLFLLRKLRPDFVVVQGYYSFSEMLAIVFGKMIAGGSFVLKGESVLPSTKSNQNYLSKGIKERLKQSVLKLILQRVEKVIYFSQKNKEFWLNYGANSKKLFWAPCVADAHKYLTAPTNNMQMELNHFSDTVTSRVVKVGFIGRLIARKRILETIQYFPKSDKYQLFIAGSGKLHKEIESYLEKYRIQNVKLLGPLQQDTLFEFINQIDVGILLSSVDPSPKVLNEFLDLGVPCIISGDVGTAHELIKDDISGYVVDQLSAHSIRKALEKIIEKDFFKNDDIFKNHISAWSGKNWADCFSKAMLND